jgi:hypothetical protein
VLVVVVAVVMVVVVVMVVILKTPHPSPLEGYVVMIGVLMTSFGRQ